MDGSEESNKSVRLMQMKQFDKSSNKCMDSYKFDSIGHVYSKVNFVITVVIKYIFAATEIGKDQG
jgi:hypothetical protein